MRWYLIDKFLEFESGRRAVAAKNVTAGEEAVDAYLPGVPVYPHSLIVEGLAQTGGLLVGEANGFREHVVLAKIARARFHSLALAGDTLTYSAQLQDMRPGGAVVRGTSRVGDRLQGEVSLIFAHLDERFEGVELFEPAGFLRTLRILGLYEVGRKPNGDPLDIPPHLAAAEADDDALGPYGKSGPAPSEKPRS